jgi:hypothetical protein
VSFTAFHIRSSKTIRGTITRLAKYGIGLDSWAKGHFVVEMTKLSDLALHALQTKVPIRTKELRNGHIKRVLDGAGGDYQGQLIYIDDAVHETTPARKKPKADELAMILEKGISRYGTEFKRSQSSDGIDPFAAESGATTDWIDHAQHEFETHAGLD